MTIEPITQHAESVLIDYNTHTQEYELWDLNQDCKYPVGPFYSQRTARNYCNANFIAYKIGLTNNG